MSRDNRSLLNSRSEAKRIYAQRQEIKRLEKENQQLKENYDRIYNENCKLREQHNITDISLLDENQQLKKQKNDAIKFLKSIEMDKTDKYIPLRDYKEFGILMNILKGGSDE